MNSDYFKHLPHESKYLNWQRNTTYKTKFCENSISRIREMKKIREKKVSWMTTLKFLAFANVAKIGEIAKFNNHKILYAFYILFYISYFILYLRKKKMSFWYTLYLVFLLDQLHLISLKLYHFYVSCNQLYFKYFLSRNFRPSDTCKICEVNHHELTNRKNLWDKLLHAW